MLVCVSKTIEFGFDRYLLDYLHTVVVWFMDYYYTLLAITTGVFLFIDFWSD